MSARDELEAEIWRQLTAGLGHRDRSADPRTVDAILGAADAYAVAVATSAEDTAEATAVRRAILQRYGLQGRRAS